MEELNLDLIKNELNNIHQGMSGLLISVGPSNDNNPYKWKCSMIAPKDSLYNGGVFFLQIIFPNDYPNRAPEIKFITPIYHININHVEQPGCPLGKVYLTALNNWNPKYRMRGILPNIYALFYISNMEHPYGINKLNEMKNNQTLFEEKIKYFTKKYAGPENEDTEYTRWDFSYE